MHEFSSSPLKWRTISLPWNVEGVEYCSGRPRVHRPQTTHWVDVQKERWKCWMLNNIAEFQPGKHGKTLNHRMCWSDTVCTYMTFKKQSFTNLSGKPSSACFVCCFSSLGWNRPDRQESLIQAVNKCSPAGMTSNWCPNLVLQSCIIQLITHPDNLPLLSLLKTHQQQIPAHHTEQ